mmetsp:Transcript_12345/g.28915  ORF Transcript_12345/g.28915 Transcript_12345/m.28915 type:complete len:329 (-) Transcript_12345:157-1143(-)
MEVGAEQLYMAKVGSPLTKSSASSGSASRRPTKIPEAAAWLVWPAIVALPLYLTFGDAYLSVFPEEWLREFEEGVTPSPLGLSLGILAVVVGQFFTLTYHWCHIRGLFTGELVPIQKKGPEKHSFWMATAEHLSQPEGFVMLGGYLSGYWMLGLMPTSYYKFTGGIDWVAVAIQLLLQDVVQYLMHFGEHKISFALYRLSHKPHHRFTNPKLFDAFNGSAADTFLMILIPLLVTSRVVHCNVWTYMAFGSLYANWLCLIHSEYHHPWDAVFRQIGFGTAADHHVHHKLFVKNYGHLFMYADWAFKTYLNPQDVSAFTGSEGGKTVKGW